MTRAVSAILSMSALILTSARLRADEPVSLERTLVRTAPTVIKYCKQHGYQNVGILKFLVHKEGEQKASDNAGTMNRTIARQVEIGLILANDPVKPIGIIEGASDIAATTPGANHLTKEGRLKLFQADFPLAWGQEKVKADALVTGILGVSGDLKSLKIQLLVFDRQTNKLEPLGKELVAMNDPRKLSEIGESFTTRGLFEKGKVEIQTPELVQRREIEALETATKVRDKAAKHPGAESSAPVKLDIEYDGRVVPFEFRDGKAFVPEPNQGQKVVLRLKRNTPQGSFACVLKVNGENTLFRQKLPDILCRKWLLLPQDPREIAVIGYQKDNRTTEQFRVLSRAESKSREIDYGVDVGMITLTVFRERQVKAPGGDLSDETQNTTILEQAKMPEKRPDNFAALTAQLLDEANRGLIAEGSTVGNEIKLVKFEPDPIPLMTLTVIYCKK